MVLGGISHPQTMHPDLRLVPGNILHLPKPQPAPDTPLPPGTPSKPFPMGAQLPAGRYPHPCGREARCRAAASPARREHGEQPRAENSQCEAGRRVRPSGSAQDPLPALRARGLPGSLRRVLTSLQASPRRATLGRQRFLPLQPPRSAPLAKAPMEGPRGLQTPRHWARDSE